MKNERTRRIILLRKLFITILIVCIIVQPQLHAALIDNPAGYVMPELSSLDSDAVLTVQLEEDFLPFILMQPGSELPFKDGFVIEDGISKPGCWNPFDFVFQIDKGIVLPVGSDSRDFFIQNLIEYADSQFRVQDIARVEIPGISERSGYVIALDSPINTGLRLYILPTIYEDGIVVLVRHLNDNEEDGKDRASSVFDNLSGYAESIVAQQPETAQPVTEEDVRDILTRLMFPERDFAQLNQDELIRIEQAFEFWSELAEERVIPYYKGLAVFSDSELMGSVEELGEGEVNFNIESLMSREDSQLSVVMRLNGLMGITDIAFDYEFLLNFGSGELGNKVLHLIGKSGEEIEIALEDSGSLDLKFKDLGLSDSFQLQEVVITAEITKGSDRRIDFGGGVISLSALSFTREAFALDQVAYRLENEIAIDNKLASLFRYNVEEFRALLDDPNALSVYGEEESRWISLLDSYPLSVVEALLNFRSDNTAFISESEAMDTDFYWLPSIFELEHPRDMDLLNNLEDKIVEVMEGRSESTDRIDLILEFVYLLSSEEKAEVRDVAWAKLTANSKNFEVEEFVKDVLIPEISIYLGYNGDITSDKSGYRGAAMYVLGYKLYEKLDQENLLSSEDKELLEDVIDRLIENKIAQQGSLSDEAIADIENSTRITFAINKILSSTEERTLIDFAYSLSEYYDRADWFEIYEQVRALNVLKKEIKGLYREPEITYQSDVNKLGIDDNEFLNDYIMGPLQEYVLAVYDPETGLILDSPGTDDANMAAVGLTYYLISSLYHLGFIGDDDVAYLGFDSVEDMMTKGMETAIGIQEKQLKEEWLYQLLPGMPLLMAEELILNMVTNPEGILDYMDEESWGSFREQWFGDQGYPEGYNEMEALSENQVASLEEGLKQAEHYFTSLCDSNSTIEDITTKLAADLIDSGQLDYMIVFDKGTEEYIQESLYLEGVMKDYFMRLYTDYAQDIIDSVRSGEAELSDLLEEGIETILRAEFDIVKQYGIEGMLPHFIDVNTGGRSKPDIEDSSIDTVLAALYFYHSSLMFPELKPLAIRFLKNMNMDGYFYKGNGEYNLAWNYMLKGVGYNGFAPLEWNYKAHERLALGITRNLWLSLNGMELEPENIYGSRNSYSMHGLPSLIPGDQGATSWIYNLIYSILPPGEDSNGTDWKFNSQLGLIYTALGALDTGLYTAETANCFGAMEIPGAGYQMSMGLPPYSDGDMSRTTDPAPDGTYSIYSLNPAASPIIAHRTLWHEWIVNPRMQGEYGSYGSSNPLKNYFSSSYYTFDMAVFGINALEAQSGYTLPLIAGDEQLSTLYSALGYDLSGVELVDTISEERIVAILGDEYVQIVDSIETLQNELEIESDSVIQMELQYKLAEMKVQQAIYLEKAMTDLSKASDWDELYRFYLANNDRLYEEAMVLLPRPYLFEGTDEELIVKSLSLSYVIEKNNYLIEEQEVTFDLLIKYLASHPGLDNSNLIHAADIIKGLDYEANVIFVGFDSETQQFIPKLSYADILEKFTVGMQQYTSLDVDWAEELLLLLSDYDQSIQTQSSTIESPIELLQMQTANPDAVDISDLAGYDIIPAGEYYLNPLEAGAVWALLESAGETPGLLDIIAEKGWDFAADVYSKVLYILRQTKPQVEEYIFNGEFLNLNDYDNAGFLWGTMAAIILEKKPSQANLRDFMEELYDMSEEEIEQKLDRSGYLIMLGGRTRGVLEKTYGRVFDIIHSEIDADIFWDYFWQFDKVVIREPWYQGARAGKYHPEGYIKKAQGSTGNPLDSNRIADYIVVSNVDTDEVDIIGGVPALTIKSPTVLDMVVQDFSAPNTFRVLAQAGDVDSSFRIRFRNLEGEEAVFRVEDLTSDEEWHRVGLPLWGPYQRQGIDDDELLDVDVPSVVGSGLMNQTWSTWLLEGVFWDKDGSGYALKDRYEDGCQIYLESDDITDWSRITEIIVEPIEGEVSLAGIYLMEKEEQYSLDLEVDLIQNQINSSPAALLVQTQDATIVHRVGIPLVTPDAQFDLHLEQGSYIIITEIKGETVHFTTSNCPGETFRRPLSYFIESIWDGNPGTILKWGDLEL